MALGQELRDFAATFGAVTTGMDHMGRMADRRARRKAAEANDPNKSPILKQAFEAYKAQGGKQPMGAIPVEAVPMSTGTSYPTYDPADYPGYAGGGEVTDQLRTAAFDPEMEQSTVPLVPAAPQQAIPVAPVAAAPVAAAPVTPAGNAPAVGAVAGEPYRPTAGGEGSSPNANSDLDAAIKGGMDFAVHNFHLKDEGAVPTPSAHKEHGAKALMSGVGAATPEMVAAVDAKVNAGTVRDEAVWNIRRLEALHRFYSSRGETDKANKAAFELIQYSAGEAAKYGTLAMADIKAGNTAGAVKNVVTGHSYIPDGHKLDVQGNNATLKDARTGQTVQQFQFTPEQLFNAAMGLQNRSMYWSVLANRASLVGKRQSTQTEAQEELTRARTDLARTRMERLKNTPIGGAGRGRGGGGRGPLSSGAQAILDRLGLDAPRSSSSGNAPASDGTREGGGDPGGGSDDEDGPASLEAPPDLKTTPEERYLIDQHKQNLGAGGIKRPDDKTSTLSSFTVGIDGKTYVLPTIWKDEQGKPQELGYDDAIKRAQATGLEKFPSYANEDEAKKRYDELHDIMEQDVTSGGNTPRPGEAEGAAGAVVAPDGTQEGGGDPVKPLNPTVTKPLPPRGKIDQTRTPDPDAVPDQEMIRQGSKYVPLSEDRGKPLPFDQAPPAKPLPFAEAPPELKDLRAARLEVMKLPDARERKEVLPLIEKAIRDQDAAVKKWEARRKEYMTTAQHKYDQESSRYEVSKRTHEGREITRLNNEFNQKRADQKEKLKAEYDYKPKPHERQQIIKDVDEAFTTAIARAKLGDQDPEKLDAKAKTAAEEKFAEAYGNSVFADPKVNPQRFKALAMDIMTSNPTPDAETSIRTMYELTKIDPTDATKRNYKVTGRDPLNNVILAVPKFGHVHLRQDAFDQLKSIVKDRLAGHAERGKEAATKAAVDAADGPLRTARKAAGKAIDDLVDKVTTVGKPKSGEGSLTKDVGDVARRAVQAIPTGDGSRLEQIARDRGRQPGPDEKFIDYPKPQPFRLNTGRGR